MKLTANYDGAKIVVTNEHGRDVTDASHTKGCVVHKEDVRKALVEYRNWLSARLYVVNEMIGYRTP